MQIVSVPALPHARTGRTRRRARLRGGSAMLAVALLALTACGSGDEGDTRLVAARTAATGLAGGLQGGDLSAVTLTGATAAEATTQRDALLEPLVDVPRTVTVKSVALDTTEETATAVFDVVWDLDGTPWAYTTQATMTLVDEAWRTPWSTDLLIPGLQPGERLTLTRTAAKRADILGAADVLLVTDRPVRHVGIDKTRIAEADLDAAARTLATLTGIDPGEYATKVLGAGAKAFVEAVTLRVEGDYDWVAIEAVPGVLLIDDVLPLAPTRGFAGAILGRAGPATAELIDASGGAIVEGDITGLSGLQRQFDEQLRGTPGILLEAVTETTARDLLRRDPVMGEPLHTTLDPAIQQLGEQVLAEQTVPAAIVAIRPSTGAVLASANSPGSEGMSTATTGMYAPGSTFKVVTALALLRSGVTPETLLDCSPEAVVDGRAFVNYPDYPAGKMGQITLTDVVANSCNTALINASAQVSQADLVSAGQSLGLGLAQQPGPATFSGLVPAGSTGTEHAASMIGQGAVQASPIAMATVAASVAAGTTIRPTFLAQEAQPVVAELPETPTTPLTPEEAAQLNALMRAVVTDGGATFLLDVPGAPVSAKTGTAQYGDGSVNHVWMIAIQGDLAVAVFVETGEYGSTTAGPLLTAFLGGLA